MKIKIKLKSETLTRIAKKVDEFRGPGLTNQHTSMSLLTPPTRQPPPVGGRRTTLLPTGDYPGQVYIVGTNNSAGFDFLFAADEP